MKKAITTEVEDYTGTSYKTLDDLLDGIFCAYLAYFFWHWGDEGCWVVGDTASGYVTLPRCQLRNCPLLASFSR